MRGPFGLMLSLVLQIGICIALDSHFYFSFQWSRERLLGYGSILLSLITFEAAAASAQGLQRAAPDIQLSVIRYIVIGIISGIFIYIRKVNISISRSTFIFIIFASLSDLLADIFFFTGVSILPLSYATGLFFSMRMVILTVLTKLYFYNDINIFTIVAVVGSVVGLILQMQPWNSFSKGFIPGFLQDAAKTNSTLILLKRKGSAQSNSTNESVMEISEININLLLAIGHGVMLFASLFSSLHLITIGIYLRLVDSSLICFVCALVCFPLSLVLMFYIEKPIYIDDLSSICLISIHAICTAFTNLLENIAYQIIPPLQSSVVESTQPILSLILQYTVFRENLSGRMNVLGVLGCLLLIASLIISTLFSMGHHHMDFEK